MSNQKSNTSINIITQDISPDKPYYTLTEFYSILLSKKFNSSVDAIQFCRDLCSSHGFTVKQEQSTHKNIYVYCSREGLPDSHRNPKVNPQRNRQSQRCECRWRIVLHENKEFWEFRKSQNVDAYIHNHPLLKPEEIKKDWPKEVSEKIFELARKRLPTNEIRQIIRDQYPDITWDDRRFYNRLSEERQKMKQRDTATRAMKLMNLSSQLCMVNAGSEDLSHYVESKLIHLLQDTCKIANMNSIPISIPFNNENASYEEIDVFLKKASVNIKQEPGFEDMNDSNSNDSKKTCPLNPSLPKGYLAVPVPEYSLFVKMYSQNTVGDIRRAIFDMQRPHSINNIPYINREPTRRRSRALLSPEDDNDDMDLDTPARKLSRQIVDDEADDLSIHSSPSNSQIMNNIDQQQLIDSQYNSYTPSTESTLFYNNNNNHNIVSNFNNTNHHHIYPSIMNANNRQPTRSQLNQQMVYGLNDEIITTTTPTNHHQLTRPHSMTFGAPMTNMMRAHSISVPRMNQPINYHQHNGFTHNSMQHIVTENHVKPRYFNIKDQQPEASRSTNLMTHIPSPNIMQQYMSQQQLNFQQQLNQNQFTNTTTFITNDPLLEPKQNQPDPTPEQLYRRASGPN